MKQLMDAPQRDLSEDLGPYRMPMAPPAQSDAEFMAEVRAGARHAVLLKRRAYLDRLTGGAHGPWFVVAGGLPRALRFLLTLSVMGALLVHQWTVGLVGFLVAVLLPVLVNGALMLVIRRTDAALIRMLRSMGSEEITSFQRAVQCGEHPAIAPGPRADGRAAPDATGGGIGDAIELVVDTEVLMQLAHDREIDLPDPFDFDD